MTTAVNVVERVDADWLQKHDNPMGTARITVVPQIGHDLVVCVTYAWGDAEIGKLYNLGRVTGVEKSHFTQSPRQFSVHTDTSPDRALEVWLDEGVSLPTY